ncbi:hypothetical protein VCHA39O220_90098 [Vibrio chagasii]|nr:hypothetical protein VCHA52P454_120091 [Vibrio chagasii]CAH7393563.1 hypothetical protein VCHA39O220_90098 [Vibrio chagasii]
MYVLTSNINQQKTSMLIGHYSALRLSSNPTLSDGYDENFSDKQHCTTRYY